MDQIKSEFAAAGDLFRLSIRDMRWAAEALDSATDRLGEAAAQIRHDDISAGIELREYALTIDRLKAEINGVREYLHDKYKWIQLG